MSLICGYLLMFVLSISELLIPYQNLPQFQILEYFVCTIHAETNCTAIMLLKEDIKRYHLSILLFEVC